MLSAWMVPSISIMVCSTVILVITYIYLFYIEKKRFLGIWLVGWTIYLAAQIITLITNLSTSNIPLNYISAELFLISSAYLLHGAYSFLGRKTPVWCISIILLTVLWNMAASIFNFHSLFITTPSAIMLGGSTLWLGIIFLYYGQEQIVLYKPLGLCFVLWGIHKVDYPLLHEISWFAPIGYLISAGFSLMITITFIFIYFQRIRLELLNTQEIVRANEKRLVTIIENQRDVIFELDKKGKLIFISPACTEIMRHSAEELQGKSFVTFIGSDMWKKVEESDISGINFEKVWIRSDNSTQYLSIYCKPNFNNLGQLSGVFGSIHDITENKLLDEAREYDKLKTEFFANISHELRTPLNVMLASTQLLELYNTKNSEMGFKDKINKTTLIVRQNIFRLSRLINNLIDITRVDAGFFELQLSNYDIVNIVEETTMSVVDYIESKDIDLEFDTDVEEKYIACDSEKIERVMLNLLSNAVKFTNPGGKIMVNVSDGENFVTISVKDTGIGIPKDKLEMIFERFRQVDKSLTRNNEGSGIGLSLVKSIVELHKGNVMAESTYGQGSEFVIKLPAVKADGNLPEGKLESFSSKKKEIEFSDIYP